MEFPESRIFEYTLDILMLENTIQCADTPEYVHRRAAAAAGLQESAANSGHASALDGGGWVVVRVVTDGDCVVCRLFLCVPAAA